MENIVEFLIVKEQHYSTINNDDDNINVILRML